MIAWSFGTFSSFNGSTFWNLNSPSSSRDKILMERRALEDEREKFESQKRMALQEEIRERERLRKEHEERKKNMDREKSEREQIWLQVFTN